MGGAWGTVDAFVPGVEASIGWRQFDFYLEGEYVRDNKEHNDSYWYAWTELGYKPRRVAAPRASRASARARSGERDIQRGPFVQFTWRNFTLGAYWFNPGSNEQVVVG